MPSVTVDNPAAQPALPSPHIEMYTTVRCSYCVAAKRMLDRLNLPYTEHDVTGNAEKRMWLVETTGRRTVPQIFWDGEPIGGYTDGLLPLLRRKGMI